VSMTIEDDALRRQREPVPQEEIAIIMRRHTRSMQTLKAQHTDSIILQIGGSRVKLTAHQACHLASLLVVQAHAVALTRTESADPFRVGGWITKPSSLRGQRTGKF
jgi:uncharacterized membrane protein (DUF441 family)